MKPPLCLRAGPVGVGDDLEPVTISASPVVAIGVDAGDKAAAEAKGPRMDLSTCVFEALHEDATLVLSRGRDRTHAGPRLRLVRLDGRGRGYILTPVGSRVALASRGVIGAEVS